MSAVTEFLKAYSDHFASRVARGVEFAEPGAQRWVEGQRLVPSGLSPEFTATIRAKHPTLPPEVAELWLGDGTRRPLEGPLFDLVATGGPSAGTGLEELFAVIDNPRYLPVGIERDTFGLGYYCIDLGAMSSMPIVYVPHPKLERDTVSPPVFGSFRGMLEVTTFLLRHDPATPLSAAETAELKLLDPVFGGEAWSRWSVRLGA